MGFNIEVETTKISIRWAFKVSSEQGQSVDGCSISGSSVALLSQGVVRSQRGGELVTTLTWATT